MNPWSSKHDQYQPKGSHHESCHATTPLVYLVLPTQCSYPPNGPMCQADGRLFCLACSLQDEAGVTDLNG